MIILLCFALALAVPFCYYSRDFIILYQTPKTDGPMVIADDWDLDAALLQSRTALRMTIHCNQNSSSKGEHVHAATAGTAAAAASEAWE